MAVGLGRPTRRRGGGGLPQPRHTGRAGQLPLPWLHQNRERLREREREREREEGTPEGRRRGAAAAPPPVAQAGCRRRCCIGREREPRRETR